MRPARCAIHALCLSPERVECRNRTRRTPIGTRKRPKSQCRSKAKTKQRTRPRRTFDGSSCRLMASKGVHRPGQTDNRMPSACACRQNARTLHCAKVGHRGGRTGNSLVSYRRHPPTARPSDLHWRLPFIFASLCSSLRGECCPSVTLASTVRGTSGIQSCVQSQSCTRGRPCFVVF